MNTSAKFYYIGPDATRSRIFGPGKLVRLIGLIAAATISSSAFAAKPAVSNETSTPSREVYAGWLQMYDLKFDDAHRTFAAWKRSHPQDALGPASDAAAWLFSELARLGALESELFVDDDRFRDRPKLHPDLASEERFTREIGKAETLADAALKQTPNDTGALFVKALTFGLRADDAGLIRRESFAALNYTKEGRVYSDRLIHTDPMAFDAYLCPGLENYLLSLKAAPVRMFLRMTGSSIDREKGLQEIRETAQHGRYLQPFAQLLLAVAALRDKDYNSARTILGTLHRRFPDNVLYTKELNRINRNY